MVSECFNVTSSFFDRFSGDVDSEGIHHDVHVLGISDRSDDEDEINKTRTSLLQGCSSPSWQFQSAVIYSRDSE